MLQHFYHGNNELFNGNGNRKSDPLHPGELRFGSVRMFPNVNEKGEAIVKFHVTNEVDMFIARNHLAHIRAMMWVAITFLVLATCSGLMVYFF